MPEKDTTIMARKRNKSGKGKKDGVSANDASIADNIPEETKNVEDVQEELTTAEIDGVDETSPAKAEADVDTENPDAQDHEDKETAVLDDVTDSVLDETVQDGDEKEVEVPEAGKPDGEDEENEENEEDDEANDSTANRFVIVDSEDESDLESDNRKNGNDNSVLAKETTKGEELEEALKKSPELKEPIDAIPDKGIFSTEDSDVKKSLAEVEKKDTEKQIDSKANTQVDIGQQPYDPELELEKDTGDKVDIGQQPYDPESELELEKDNGNGNISSYESKGPTESHRDLAFISPAPVYKYIENKTKQEKLKELTSNFVFGLAVVDFDHIKGPELTYWLDDEVIAAYDDDRQDQSVEQLLKQKVKYYSKIWPYLAFQALPDGVHMYGETFTQFTLCYDELKKTDVELDFDLVDLVFDDDKDARGEDGKTGPEVDSGKEKAKEEDKEGEKEEGEEEAVKDAADGTNVDTEANGKFVNVDLSTQDETETDEVPLEKVRTRPVVVMEDPNQGVITLFGCACIRQLESALLKKTDQKTVKRSVVQKSVILLTRSPLPIQLREKLSIVTQSWFEQCDFSDREILKALYVHISNTYNKHGYLIEDDDLYEVKSGANSGSGAVAVDEGCKIIKESDFYMGLNFQEVVLKLRRQLLVLFKCLVLAKYRILFFSKDLNALSNTQYCLIGLISNLLLNLSDSGYPLSDSFLHEEKLKSQSLKSSDRSSILRFLGLPLRVFGFGSFFQPYLTLQQLSYITNVNTKSFVVGSSNDIILEHKKEWFDVIVYLDEKDGGLFGSGGCKVEILNRSLKDKVGLTWEDRKFVDYVIQCVDTHHLQDEKEDEEDEQGEDATAAGDGDGSERSKPKSKSKTVNSNTSIDNGAYKGGDDFIRSQFEDYLIGFLSCVKYDDFLRREERSDVVEQLKLDNVGNDIGRFNAKWVDEFRRSTVYEHWNEITENELFNFFEPQHVGKDIGRTEMGESRFRGGAVFRSWLSKWKEPSREPSREPQEKDTTPEDAKDGSDAGAGAGAAADADADADANVPGAKTVNTFGRDVGLFFKRIGDNTSATFAQRLYGAGAERGEAEPEAEADKEDAGGASAQDRDSGPGFENRLRGLFQWGKKEKAAQ